MLAAPKINQTDKTVGALTSAIVNCVAALVALVSAPTQPGNTRFFHQLKFMMHTHRSVDSLMTRGPIQFDVSVSYGLPRAGLPSAQSFKKWATAAVTGRILKADLAIRVVDTKEGCSLNRHYCGKDYATNVLSFPADLPEAINVPLLGDLVICAPVVAKEAEEQGKTLAAHYAHLTIHGVLHLLGLNHEDEREAVLMEQLERDILADLGFTDPYAGEN